VVEWSETQVRTGSGSDRVQRTNPVATAPGSDFLPKKKMKFIEPFFQAFAPVEMSNKTADFVNAREDAMKKVITTSAIVTLGGTLLFSLGLSFFFLVNQIVESQVQYLQQMNLAQ
jgi:hypothetical protein